MSRGLSHPQILTGVTGQIVGFPGQTVQQASFACTVHGWAFFNSDSAAHNVKFYIPVGSSTAKPAIPSASGNLAFQINVGVTTGAAFAFDQGLYFKDGLFVVCDNADVIGSLFVS
jgi:hypothetical protein